MAKLDLLVDVNVNGANKISSLGGTLAKGAINVAKVAVPVAGAIAGLTALAATAETSQVKLESAFRNTGKSSGKTLQQLEADADRLGEALTFDDEGIMEAQAALLSFQAVSGTAFDRTIQGAADFAAATGTDLTAATQKFGKALADPVKGLGSLRKAGIVFTEQQEDQIRKLQESGDTLGAQDVILSAIEDRYAGVNEALSNSAAGETAQAMEDLTNAGEEIGAIFLPILAELAKGVQGFAHFIRDNFPAIQAVIATVGEVIGTVFSAIVDLFSGFTSGGTGDAFAGVWRVIGQAVDFVSKQVFPFLLNIFQQVVAFIRENGPTIGSIVSQAFGAIIAVAKVVVPILMNIAKVVFPIILTAAGILLKGLDGTFKLIGGVFNVAGKVVDTIVKSITTAWQLLSTITTAIWTGITNTIKGVFNAVADVINGFFGFLNGLSFGIGPFDVGPVHIDAATFDPFNIPLIPHLAQGGIISSPTLALLGEAGPEAVVPLGSGNKLGGDVHYHVDVRGEEPFIRNETDLTRTLQRTAFLAGF
jgi:phage-related protein